MKAMRLRAGLVVLTGLAIVLGALLAPSTAVAGEEELRDALTDYAAGRYDEALVKLRDYVAANPGADEVYAVLKSADEKVLLRVLAQQGEHERLLTYLWEKARPAARERRADEADIEKLVSQALSSDLDVRLRAGLQLKAVGELAVPALYPHLASDDAEQVVYAMFALQRVGPDATLALAEVLKSDDARLRGFVAAVLGDIRDPRGVPALLRAASGDADEGVRAKAAAALAKIGGERATTISPAVAYTTLGERYYSNDPTIVAGFDDVRNLWRWEDGALARFQVPAYLYAYQMAEQLATEALSVDPAHRPAQALLVRALLAQKVEADVIRSNGGEAPEVLGRAFDVASSQGFQAASDALRASLLERDWDVAVEAVELVRATYGNESLERHPLGAALLAPEKRVRYAAAIAALHMSPKGGMPNADKVATLAAQAASESAIRQVLVVDDREETRNRLVMDAAHAGFVAAGEPDGARAVSRAKAAPTLDVIVVRADLGDPARTIPSRRLTSAIQVIDELLSDARTRDMRIVVLVGDTSEAKADALQKFFEDKYGESVKGYVMAPVDTTSAMETINAAAEAGDLNPDRERANALAARAADAFASTDLTCASFNLKVALEPLVTAATEGPTPEVRLNAVRALGNLRVGGAEALTKIVKEGEGDDLRAAASLALGSVLSVMDGEADQIDALIEAASGEGAVAEAALKALGKVRNLTAEQRRQIFETHRLPVSEKAGS